MIDPHSADWEQWLNKWFVRLLLPAILVNISGLFVRIIEPDGALYAMISRTMAETGDLINLRAEGRDWLDKPHFPFWMAAISFRIFGVNSFAYKLPALLFLTSTLQVMPALRNLSGFGNISRNLMVPVCGSTARSIIYICPG